MNRTTELYTFLREYLTDHKKELFRQVLDERTRHITVVLEDIYQPHNASAVLRSCDCFGIQDVHIIENDNPYYISRDVALGSAQWLNLYRYDKDASNTQECLTKLKQEGYKIVATTPHTKDTTIDMLDIDSPIAVVFGNEQDGVSEEVEKIADEFVRIPMYGFTESFNISVAAALTLYELVKRLKASNIPWAIPESDQTEILLQWAKTTIKRVDKYIHEFDRRNNG